MSSTVQYYWQLRTLAYGWAWAGNFKFRDPDGQERTFITLGEAQTYADEALRATMEYGSGSLVWLTKNDLATRGKMAGAIRRSWSAGQALKEAWHQCYLEWKSPAMQPVPDHAKLKRPAEPEGAPPQAKKVRNLKGDAWQTISMVKGGRRLCKRYNDARGCANGDCADLHQCDVKLPSGKPCLSSKHNRQTHPTE